jgi:hypothetical protein
LKTGIAIAALASLGLLLGLWAPPTAAQGRGGKLLLTGGVSTIDGAAGGGLTPWAVTGGYGTQGQWGATAFVTGVETRDYALTTTGAALAFDDRFELSLARQAFDTRDNLAALGLAGLRLKQDIVGFKWRIAGDAVLDSDRWLPQIAIGLLHKRSDAGALAPTLHGALGAARSGSEFYLSATKLLLAQGLLVNATLRATKANQGGLLGHGGAQSDSIRPLPELSLAWLLSPRLAVGIEARVKPDHLYRSALGTGALKEDDWFDAFIVWAPNKQLSVTAAVVDLGRIVPALQPRRQTGAYLSVQLAH